MKKLTLYLFLAIFSLFAQEPTLSKALEVKNNSDIRFKYIQSSYSCYPHGILTLEALLQSKNLLEECKVAYKQFDRKKPYAKHFGETHFKIEQFYHVQKNEDNCIIFSNGTKSYSELLLENGYALIDPKIRDDLWDYRYLRAQKRAQVLKKGVWDEKHFLLNSCIKNLVQ